MFDKRTLIILYSIMVLWIVVIFSIPNHAVRFIILTIMCIMGYNLGKLDGEIIRLREGKKWTD